MSDSACGPDRNEPSLAGARQAARGLGSREGWIDPYPYYAALRRFAPVHYDESLGMYLLSRYRDCHHVLTSQVTGVPSDAWHDQTLPNWREHPAAVWCFTSLPLQGRADHGRIRALVNKAFTRRRVTSLHPTIDRVLGALLDSLQEQGGGGQVVDLQEVVGFRLPLTVIASLVGVPDEDLPRFRWLFSDVLRVMDAWVDPTTLARADEAMVEVRSYFTELLRERRARPRHDLTSSLLAAASDGDTVSDDELLSLIILLFEAGSETTTLSIGTGTYALLSNRDEYDLLRADPSLAGSAVEEIFRWDCVGQRVVRIAEQDLELDGAVIPAGSVIAALLGAANRDPEVFEDPNRFDVRRDGTRHLTFGAGIYGCLGFELARAELRAYLAGLTRRFPDVELAGEPVRREGFFLRGLDTLPVALGTRQLV
jgi:cytochrome P450